MCPFPDLEPVCFSMSSSNCCFLTCIEISQEASQVVWYSHLFQNFPHFFVIHTVKGFGTVNNEEIDVFLEFSYFFNDPTDVGNFISGSSAFLKSSLNIWNSQFLYCWSLAWRFFFFLFTCIYLFLNFILFLNFKHCISFAKHQNESATGLSQLFHSPLSLFIKRLYSSLYT